MAAAQIPMGVLGTVTEDDDLADVIREVIDDRFFETLRERPYRSVTDTGGEGDSSAYVYERDVDREAFPHD